MFWVLAGADTNDALEAIDLEVSPLLARHYSEVYQDPAIFARIAALYGKRDALGLDAEQLRVLERYHTAFVRSGAALGPERAQAPGRHQRAAGAASAPPSDRTFSADEQGYVLTLEREEDLAGLPDFVRQAAQAAAEERGLTGKYAITLSRSSIEPFLEFSTRRDLREQALPRVHGARRP